MTYEQLEQFLKTDFAGCDKYARCAHCDRSCDYPCARAFDALVKKRSEEGEDAGSWLLPEPDVQEKFGTVFASGNEEEKIQSYAIAHISFKPREKKRNTRILVIKRRAK